MTTETTSLETVIAQTRARRAAEGTVPPVKSNWGEAYGAVENDEIFREAARLGEEWRKQENQRR